MKSTGGTEVGCIHAIRIRLIITAMVLIAATRLSAGVLDDAEKARIGVVLAQTKPKDAPAAATPAPEGLKIVPVLPELEKEFEAAVQIASFPERTRALCAIGVKWSKNDPIAALVWGDYIFIEGTIIPHHKTKDTEEEYRVFLAVVADCGKDPVRAKILGEWLISPQCTITQAWHKLMALNSGWAGSDPVACTALCLKAPPSLRYIAFSSAGRRWVGQDPVAATEWTLKLESAKDRYSAIMGVADRLGNTPVATEWIKKLTPEEAKTAARIIAQNQQSQKKHDETALKEWVDKLPLSDPDKEYVLKGPRINTFSSDIYTKGSKDPATGK